MFSVKHLIRRLNRQRLITASIMLGIALAVALGVAVPLATNALATIGLQATVAVLPRASQSIQLTRPAQAFNAAFQKSVRDRLGYLLASDHTVDYTALTIGRVDGRVLELTVRLRTQGGLAEHTAVEGRLPTTPAKRRLAPGDPGCDTLAPVETLLSAEQLKINALAIGDRLCLANQLPVVIVGSFVANNVADDYWFGDHRPLTGEVLRGGMAGGTPVVVLMFAPEDFTYAQSFFDRRASIHVYRALTQPRAINLDTLADADDRLRQFRNQMVGTQPRPTVLTGLDEAIATFNSRFRLLQSALATLLVGIVTLAIVYVVLVGSLATEQQSAEMAVLRSRGGSGLQVWGGHIAQACILAIPGAILGAILGALLVLLLRETSLFRRLGGQEAFRLYWNLQSSLPALVILLLVLAGVILAGRPALAQSLVTLRQDRARPPRASGWGRRQFELLVLLLGLLGWWQLRRYGGTLTTTLDGATQFNVLLLAAPILMLVAGSVLFLRVFAVAARGLGWLWGRRRGLVGALSAWQLARNPLLYGRLVLLLTLTVGLGIYTQTVSSTIAAEQLRQALEEAGADIRLPLGPADDPAEVAAAYPARSQALLTVLEADVMRLTKTVEDQIGSVDLVGVDGPALATVLEQSGSDDAALLGALRVTGAGAAPPPGLVLPPATRAIAVRLKGVTTDITVHAMLAGSNGVRQVPVGKPAATWQTFEVAIPSDLAAPIALQSFVALPDARKTGRAEVGISIDDVTALTASAPLLLESFGASDRWEPVGPGETDTKLYDDEPAGGDGTRSARIGFGALTDSSWAALRFRVPAIVPAYSVQRRGAAAAPPGQPLRLRVGQRRLEAQVQGVLTGFPGVDNGRSMLIADRERVAELLTYGLPVSLPPNELRLALRPGAAVGTTATDRDSFSKEAELVQQAADPLGNGVRVVLLLGFICALILSVVGFLTYTALTIRSRQLDWAVLRAIGISPRELLLLIGAEQAFVLGGGVLAGGAVGILLSTTTGPFLQVVTRNASAVRVVIDWGALVLLVGSLLAALALALLLLLAAARRRGMTRALRLGEA